MNILAFLHTQENLRWALVSAVYLGCFLLLGWLRKRRREKRNLAPTKTDTFISDFILVLVLATLVFLSLALLDLHLTVVAALLMSASISLVLYRSRSVRSGLSHLYRLVQRRAK